MPKKETVKLGLMPPLTGLVGIYGAEISRAALIACNEVNENGGVLGMPLELVIEDDGSLPDSAVAAAEKLVDVHKCAAIIGNLLSNSRIAVTYRVAEPRKIPLLNFSFYEGSILSHYFFHFAALPNQQIDRMIPFMRKKYGPKMFFSGNNYEWPRGSIDAAKKALLRAGGEIIGEEYCPIGITAKAIDHLLDQVEEAAPDVFVPYFAGVDQVNLLTRFTERGLKQHMAVVMGHYDEIMASILPPEVREGFYSSNTYFMSIESEENRNYLARMNTHPEVNGIWPHGNGIMTNFGEGAYICVKAFAQAANAAGSLDAESLINALKTIRVSAPQGTLQINDEHHHAMVNTYLTRCNREGTFEIVENFGAIEPVIPERYKHQNIGKNATLEEDIRLQARMLEQMSEAVFLIRSSDGIIVYVNAGMNKLFGYEQDEMLGMHISRINDLTDSDPQQTSAGIFNILNQTGKWSGDIRNVKKDGTPVWCASTVTTFTHPAYGEVWLGVKRDITALKTLQLELENQRALLEQQVRERTEAEEQLRLVIKGTNDGVWDWNIITGEDYLSPRWKEILGYRDDELPNIAESFFNLIHPDDQAQVNTAVSRHLNEGMLFDMETRLRHKDGSYRWILSRGEAVRDENNQPVRMVGTISDITERKLTEKQLKQLNEELESRVEQRTLQMKSAMNEAERANAAKSVFLSRMSHELRTPLNAILGFGQVLQMDSEHPLTQTQSESLDEIMHGGKHLLELVDEILDLARIESGKLDIRLEPLLPLPIIESCIKQLHPMASKHNIRIALDHCVSRVVNADAIRIKEVFFNLLTNAIKYNRKGGSVKISSFINGDYLRFIVQDSGNGIPAESLPRLFQPFERLESAYLGIDGTGIGLALAKKLVEGMHGEIGVESTVGVGSIFWFELPMNAPTLHIQQ